MSAPLEYGAPQVAAGAAADGAQPQAQQPQPQPQAQQPQPQAPLLGLPAPRPAAPGEAPTHLLDVRTGASVSLDHLGPVVVGVDGTLARIGNWATLTPHEREVTQRRIAERNNARLAQLRAQNAVGAPLD
jgi:hypothetical protein